MKANIKQINRWLLLPAMIQLFLLPLLVLRPGSLVHSADAADSRPELPVISDTRVTAQLSNNKQLPILIMFGTRGCPFCHLLKEDFLIPMIISGDYTDKVILRQLYIEDGKDIIDFSGQKISAAAFAQRYGVRLFPTTVLVDHQGQPLVNNIVGVTTPSLFGGTLDDVIDEALSILRHQN